MSQPKLGSGKRFEKLKEMFGREKGVYNPAGLAAAVGRKKYGQKKMTKLAENGKKK